MPLSPADLARLFAGRLDGDGDRNAPLAGMATDSRSVPTGGAFVAVRGEAQDGHAYVAQAAGRGAALAVVEERRRLEGPLPPLLLRVPDTSASLRAACERRLRELGSTVVGITGSVGKTTAKELCALALSGRRVARTPGNLNTWTGVPLSVLTLEPPVDVFVAEMAMSARGEIADLASFTHPHIGVLLNVGLAHVGLLGSIEAIADAKAELLQALPRDGAACVNADDPQVRRVASRSGAPLTWFGLRSADATVRATDVRPDGLNGVRFTLHAPDGTAPARLAVPGEHVVVDACAAAAVATRLGVAVGEVAERLASFRAPDHRGEVRTGVGGALVYDDCYNSSPTSLAAALDVLAGSGRPVRVAVIGDMLELGDMAVEAHEEAGRHAARSATDLVAVGAYADVVADAAVAAGMPAERVHVAAGADGAARLAIGLCRPDAAVLVKASHSVALEQVVERLVP